ncbi:MAG: dinuclear metal center YbgI/SA1388 family protein [Francisellaceae bacterium]|jgi:dinuclear metal center YbgI/SA1388 family protein
MSIKRNELQKYLNQLLSVEKFKDYCPNGLQIEGGDTIKKIVCGVTSCQELIDKAIELQADAILVHHGFFWKGESYPLVGMKKRRIAALIKHDINLFVYHLPLDAHITFGNNAQLAKLLNLEVIDSLNTNSIPAHGIITRPQTEISPQQLNHKIKISLDRKPIHISSNKTNLKTIAICTGGAQGYITNAVEQGADAYISGEISENTTHIAKECNIDYFAAGHHATERYGIKSLGEHLEHKFNLNNTFIDIDNPA